MFLPKIMSQQPRLLKKVSGADIVLANGLGYDAWLNKLAKTSKNTKLIRVGEDVLNKSLRRQPALVE